MRFVCVCLRVSVSVCDRCEGDTDDYAVSNGARCMNIEANGAEMIVVVVIIIITYDARL